MKRVPRIIEKRCPTCCRDGWAHQEYFSLWTEEEWGDMGLLGDRLTDAPQDAEKCVASAGANIHAAVAEGIGLAKTLGKPVAFEFNGQTVIVRADSSAEKVVRGWWQRVYDETPEESFRKR